MPRPVSIAAIVFALGVAGCGSDDDEPDRSETPSSDVVTVTDESFEALVLKSRKPVLVDFWAAWCRPCLDMKPAVRAAAAEVRGRAVVAELDAEGNAFTAEKYGVRSFPTLIVFRNGDPVTRLEGLQSERDLVGSVEDVIAAQTERSDAGEERRSGKP